MSPRVRAARGYPYARTHSPVRSPIVRIAPHSSSFAHSFASIHMPIT